MRFSARFLAAVTLTSLLCHGALLTQSYPKAQMLAEHGLLRDAKRELIDVIFAPASNDATTQAKAYFLLGRIAIDEGDVGAARERWTELQTKFPASPEARQVAKRVAELAQLVPATSRSAIHDPVARSYLRNGDFWSQPRHQALQIDARRITAVEAAVKWYDKVIEDFPKSRAAEAAGVAKVETLLAWRAVDPGREKLADDPARFAELAIAAFARLAKDFPDADALQRLRYLIAESFRHCQMYKEAEQWLLYVVKEAGDQGDFYRDLANRRLEKLKLSR